MERGNCADCGQSIFRGDYYCDNCLNQHHINFVLSHAIESESIFHCLSIDENLIYVDDELNIHSIEPNFDVIWEMASFVPIHGKSIKSQNWLDDYLNYAERLFDNLEELYTPDQTWFSDGSGWQLNDYMAEG